MLSVGTKAPAFTLPDQNGKMKSLSDFKGQKVILYFYPKDKECPADNVFRIVWYSPWRVWEYKPLDDYRADGRMHVTGHYPVQKIDPKEWPGSRKPAMPAPYIDFENGLVNIDLGCAYYHLRDSRFPQASLCCMDLERFEEDPGKAFMFFS